MEKSGILQYGVAHFGSLFRLVTGDCPWRDLLIKIPAWDPYLSITILDRQWRNHQKNSGHAQSCKLNHIDPQRYLTDGRERIAQHPINRIDALLPWNLAEKLQQPVEIMHALTA